VAFWRYPWDPRLPGLEVAWEKNSLLGMLEAAGAKLHALPTLRNLSYSPGTHAVIEIQLAPEPRRLLRRAPPAEAETLYLKVMQPSEVEHVQRAHVELLDVLPVPQCLAWSANLGVLLMDAVTGETVWERVIDRQPLPGPEVFIEILDRLAATVLPGDVVATTGSQAVTSGEILKATVPEEAGRVDELVAYCADEEDQPLTTVHGDFHENQVLLGDEGVTGIVDLDEVGPGHRVDDMAMLVGRLWASAPLDAERSADFERYALELFEGFARRLGSGRELHRRCAAVMVGRATNPFRFTSATWREETIAGLDLAERWLREGPR
jgi:aminoglycoside phosphotransferase